MKNIQALKKQLEQWWLEETNIENKALYSEHLHILYEAEQIMKYYEKHILAELNKKVKSYVPRFPKGGVIVGKQASSISEEDKPKVVCFCGSTRFAQYFMIKRWELEKQGIITLGINILPDNYFIEGNSHGAEQEGVKEILDELHKRKIDLSDEVFVLNVGGYIGESTRGEIEYAIQTGKPIKYLEP